MKPDPSRPATRIPIRVQSQQPQPVVVVPHGPAGEEEQPPQGREVRRWRIRPDHLEEFGHTPGCIGCQHHQAGLEHRGHSEHCRARLLEAMRQSVVHRAYIERQEQRYADRKAAEQERVHERKNSDKAEASPMSPKEGVYHGDAVDARGEPYPAGSQKVSRTRAELTVGRHRGPRLGNLARCPMTMPVPHKSHCLVHTPEPTVGWTGERD